MAAIGVRNTSRLVWLLGRSFSTGRYVKSTQDPQVHPVYYKVKEKQALYQKDNGLLIHQRNRQTPLGKVAWYLTLATLVAGTTLSLNFIYNVVYPPKK